MGDPSPLVLPLLAVDLSSPPLGLLSLRFIVFRYIILGGSSPLVYTNDCGFPLRTFP